MSSNRAIKSVRFSILFVSTFFFYSVRAQETSKDSLLANATLQNVVEYALIHQPAVQQAQIDEEVASKMIKGKLADWYPQVNFAYDYRHITDLQSSVIGGNLIRFGVENTSSAQFTATQNLFNRDALLASSTASKVRIAASQNTSRSKIDVVVTVTKAFYDVLATSQQIKVSEESIVRLQRSLKDAYSRYKSGVADKTDYKRATIQLSNTEASLKSSTELLKFKMEYLKALIGYPLNSNLTILYDTLQMESEVALDTLQDLNYTEHIDYQILYTQKELQNANVKYANQAFLPNVSLYGAYILNYQNSKFSELYDTKYPYSYVGATMTFPIFQGGKRIAKIQEQKWTTRRLDWSLKNLQNVLNAEYTRAMSSYKSNLATYIAQKENVELAKEVYDVIQLQYKNGIRPYLDVTIAETDLRTTRINYFNALYLVLASKMDVQRALGQINY